MSIYQLKTRLDLFLLSGFTTMGLPIMHLIVYIKDISIVYLDFVTFIEKVQGFQTTLWFLDIKRMQAVETDM